MNGIDMHARTHANLEQTLRAMAGAGSADAETVIFYAANAAVRVRLNAYCLAEKVSNDRWMLTNAGRSGARYGVRSQGGVDYPADQD